MSIDESNGKDRIEVTLDYAAAAAAAAAEPGVDPSLPKGNAFMQGFLQLGRSVQRLNFLCGTELIM